MPIGKEANDLERKAEAKVREAYQLREEVKQMNQQEEAENLRKMEARLAKAKASGVYGDEFLPQKVEETLEKKAKEEKLKRADNLDREALDLRRKAAAARRTTSSGLL